MEDGGDRKRIGAASSRLFSVHLATFGPRLPTAARKANVLLHVSLMRDYDPATPLIGIPCRRDEDADYFFAPLVERACYLRFSATIGAMDFTIHDLIWRWLSLRELYQGQSHTCAVALSIVLGVTVSL